MCPSARHFPITHIRTSGWLDAVYITYNNISITLNMKISYSITRFGIKDQEVSMAQRELRLNMISLKTNKAILISIIIIKETNKFFVQIVRLSVNWIC